MEQTNKQAALAAIDRYADRICRLSDAIWDFAELSLQEHRSAELYCAEWSGAWPASTPRSVPGGAAANR